MDISPVPDPATRSDLRTAIACLRSMLRTAPPEATELESLELIAELEELSSAVVAAQSRAAVAFEDLRIAREAADGVPVADRGVRTGDEIGFARRQSPASGRAFLTRAHALIDELPTTFDALEQGRISEDKARAVVDETAGLGEEDRRQVEAELAPHLENLGTRSLRRMARAIADDVTSEEAAAKVARAFAERRVTMRPLRHGMAKISATLPAPQAIAVYDGLKDHAASVVAQGDEAERTVPQVMADAFVTRLTGQASPEAVPVEISMVMSAESLLGDGTAPAWFPGIGPFPAGSAREFIAADEARVFLRRVFTAPEDGQLVSMESRGRVFTGQLRRMVLLRDDVCRSPWCDAPIKHVDHISPVASGGQTTWDNASGLCASCNYAKEHSGWCHRRAPGGGGLEVRTPAGRIYSVPDPPLLLGRVSGSIVPPPPAGAGNDPPGNDAGATSANSRLRAVAEYVTGHATGSRVEEIFAVLLAA